MADLGDAPFLRQETAPSPVVLPDAPFSQKEPDLSGAKKMFETNLANAPFTTGKEPSVMDAIEAGLQISVSGLVARGKAPDKILPENLPFAQRIAGNVATLAGDLPWMTAGALLGGAAGAPTGPGAAVTAFAGAFALPAGLRATLMDSYEKGDFKSAGDFFERFAGIMWQTAKGWMTGAATGGAGYAAKAVLPVAAPAAAQFVAPTAAEIVAMTTVGQALEGEMPKAQDFVDAAVIIFGAKMAVGGAAKLRAVYAKTGVKPQQILEDVQKDPSVSQELMSTNKDVPTRYEQAVEPAEAAKAPAAEPTRPADIKEPTDPQKAVLDRITQEPATKRSYSLSELYKDAKDELHPIKEMVDELSAGKELPTAKDPYKLARLTRGSYGLAEQALEYGMFKWETLENVSKGMNEIIRPVEKDLDGLRAYLLSKHAIETEALGKKTGVPLDAAQKVVAEGAGKYDKVSAELQQYLEGQLNWLVDSGIVAKDKADLWRDMYKAYIPLFRVMDTGEMGPKGAGRGLTVRQPIKGRVGSERIIVDPLESIIKNTYTFAQLADRNNVGKSLLALAEESGRTDLMAKVAAPVRPIEVQAPEVAAFLKQFGLEQHAGEFTIFRRDALTPARDEIAIYSEGKREVYKVPEEVANAFKATDRQSANMLVQILAVPARVLRAGAVLSPEFLGRNPIRDQFTAYVLSRNGYVPILDMTRGLLSIAKKDQDFQNWLKSGGANAAMVSIDRDYVQMQIAKRAGSLGYMDKAWNVVKSPIEGLQIISELMENATRLGEFKKAVGADTSKEAIQRAGFEAREVTVDFQRIGAKTRSMNMITAFWNANLEGLDRTARGIRERPMETMTRIGASITLPSIMLWWANHDDPRWKEIPNWQRDLFWIVMTKEHIYRIPKPFELGVIFGSSVERILDAFFDAKPEAFKDFSSSVGNMFGVNMIPTVATPILGQITNYNLFTDRPVIPSSMERLLPEYQYMPYTTETTKALGHLIGTVPSMHGSSFASPLVIENYVRQWSGGLGMYALQIADAALRKTGVLPDPIRPASTLSDIPFVKGFVIRYPSASAQSIQDFYDRYTKASKVRSSIKYLAQQGDVEAAIRESRLDPTLLVRMEGIHEGLSNAHRVLMLIDKNQSFNSDEKRQLMDNVYTQMIQMANAGNRAALEVEKALGEQK